MKETHLIADRNKSERQQRWGGRLLRYQTHSTVTAAQNRGQVFNIIHLILVFLFLVFRAGFQSYLQYPSLTNAMHALFFLASIYKVAYPSHAVPTKNSSEMSLESPYVQYGYRINTLFPPSLSSSPLRVSCRALYSSIIELGRGS